MNMIKRLKELEVKATPGEWELNYMPGAEKQADGYEPYPGIRRLSIRLDYASHGLRTEDAALIAEMRNALIPLLDRMEKLEAVVERAQALVRSEHSPMLTEVRLGRRQFAKLVSALADLEGDTDEVD